MTKFKFNEAQQFVIRMNGKKETVSAKQIRDQKSALEPLAVKCAMNSFEDIRSSKDITAYSKSITGIWLGYQINIEMI